MYAWPIVNTSYDIVQSLGAIWWRCNCHKLKVLNKWSMIPVSIDFSFLLFVQLCNSPKSQRVSTTSNITQPHWLSNSVLSFIIRSIRFVAIVLFLGSLHFYCFEKLLCLSINAMFLFSIHSGPLGSFANAHRTTLKKILF